MVIDDNIDGIGVMQVSADVIDEKTIRYARQAVGRGPALPTVIAHVNAPVIGARIQQAFDQWRF